MGNVIGVRWRSFFLMFGVVVGIAVLAMALLALIFGFGIAGSMIASHWNNYDTNYYEDYGEAGFVIGVMTGIVLSIAIAAGISFGRYEAEKQREETTDGN